MSNQKEIGTSQFGHLFLEGDIDNVIDFLKSCKRQAKEQGYKNINISIDWSKTRPRFRLFGDKAKP